MAWPQIFQPETSLPPVMLSGAHLYLRPPQAHDWEQWAKIRAQNQSRLKPLEPSWAENALTPEFFKRRLARQYKDWQEDRGQPFLIFSAANNSLIGGVNINNIYRGAAQSCSLGYWIDAAYEGRGLMCEALGLITQYCFSDLKLYRIHAATLPQNMRSKALLLRCGFEEEGYAKRYLKIDGRWQDHILFGLCKPE